MSEKIFPDTLLTTAGRQMIVDSQGGSTLTFTRVALGDGVLAQGQDQSALTAIISEKLSANISSYTDNEDGTFSLVFSVNNSTLDVGFMHREIGIMAKVDDGEEQLYAYTNAGTAATFLYDKTTPIQERVVRIDFVVGSAENLSVEIDGSVVYPTRGEVQQMINAHDSSAASHPLTIDDTVVPVSDSAPLATILNNVANMLKQVKGDNDWKTAPGISLAAILGDFATNLSVTTDPDTGVFTCASLGITGLMAQNGYICLGKLFGGLILQWGFEGVVSTAGKTVTFPISFTTRCAIVLPVAASSSTSSNAVVLNATITTVKLYATNNGAGWLAVGY
jgi:hypothetical protein